MIEPIRTHTGEVIPIDTPELIAEINAWEPGLPEWGGPSEDATAARLLTSSPAPLRVRATTAHAHAMIVGGYLLGLPLSARLLRHWLRGQGEAHILDPSYLMTKDVGTRAAVEAALVDLSSRASGSETEWIGVESGDHNRDIRLALRGIAIRLKRMSSDPRLALLAVYKRYNFDPGETYGRLVPGGSAMNALVQYGRAENFDVIGRLMLSLAVVSEPTAPG